LADLGGLRSIWPLDPRQPCGRQRRAGVRRLRELHRVEIRQVADARQNNPRLAEARETRELAHPGDPTDQFLVRTRQSLISGPKGTNHLLANLMVFKNRVIILKPTFLTSI